MKLPVADRFWSKVAIAGQDECWEWQATRTTFGYGCFRIGSLTDGTRKHEMAHRMAYTLTTGQDIPAGKVVMHSCDNPRCVNPAHLSVGTYSENGKAAYDRHRRVSTVRPGEGHPRAKLTEADVRTIRAIGTTQPLRVLAAQYGVSESTIDAVRRRVNWTHV